MIRLNYFSISTHISEKRAFLLRLVVVSGHQGEAIDHYYEYGAITDRLALDDSLWSIDPEALIDHIPKRFQFMTSMDVRQFARNDLADALDGSFLADDIEMIEQIRPPRAPARLAIKPVFRGPVCFATLRTARA